MNYEEMLRRELTLITPADEGAMARAAVYQGTLAKPPGSLGELENIYIRLCGITGTLCPGYTPCRIIVLCADNGVVEEGVSVTPRSVTAAQAVNMTRHCTGMSAMAHHFGDQVQVVDVGIADEYHCPEIVNRKIRPGTRNLGREPAMTRQETAQAVCTGRGGGMTDAGFLRKKQVITRALALHRPDKNDALDVLSKVGGLDLAAMCGVFLGAGRYRLPVVIDGFISVVAALCAYRLCPAVGDYLFASHLSREVGYTAAIEELGLAPWLHLGMRLGEGSGCPIAFRVLEAACAAARGMATFEGAAIDDSYLNEIRGKDCF